MTATDPPGANWAVSVLTVRWPQVTWSEPSAAVAVCWAMAVAVDGVAGDGGGPGGLGGGAVDVEAGAGQAAEGDDEEQHQDEQRGEQHQLGGDAARLVAPAGRSRRTRRRPVMAPAPASV